MLSTEIVTKREATVTCGPITLDTKRPRVTVDGRRILLTPTEYRLLRALMLKPDIPLTRVELARAAWGYADAAAGRRIDTHLHRVRTKLGMRDGGAGGGLPQIRPERNWGYELITTEA